MNGWWHRVVGHWLRRLWRESAWANYASGSAGLGYPVQPMEDTCYGRDPCGRCGESLWPGRAA